MKRFIHFIALIILTANLSFVYSQEIVQIGSGSNTTAALPIYGEYQYSYSQQIYLQNEINLQGHILKIRFYFSGGFFLENSNQWSVYMGHTSKSSFENENDWIDNAELSLVFSGDIIFPNSGEWLEINLSTPFNYNNSDNIIISVHETKYYSSMNVDWGSFSAGANRGLCFASIDEVNPNNPDQANIFTGNIPQIQLYIITAQCPEPENIIVSNISSNSAEIHWASFGNEISWFVKCGISGFDPDTDGTILQATSIPFILENLESNTEYDIYIMADCDDDLFSDWSGPVSFTTTCDAFTEDIYESFESATAPADCWSIVYGSSSPPPDNLVTHSTDIASDGSRSLRFSSSDYDPVSFSQYLISPEINFTGEVKVSFKYRKALSYRFDEFRVGYSLTDNNIEHFSWQETITDVSSNLWADYDFTFPTGTKYIAIQYNPDETDWSGEYLYIDELSIISEDIGTILSLQKEDIQIQIYPNPTNGLLFINSIEFKDFEIFDISGKLVETGKLLNNITTIDITNRNSGIYFMRISDNNNTYNFKIIKE